MQKYFAMPLSTSNALSQPPTSPGRTTHRSPKCSPIGKAIVMIFWILVPWTLFAESDTTAAPATGVESAYQNRITQSAPAGAPAAKLFVDWILAEMNNDSLMREEIADDLDALQENPHNSNFMTAYLRPDKHPAMRLSFKAADIAIKCTGGGKEGIYNYQVLLRAEDYGHRSDTTIRFRFTFQVKTDRDRRPVH